MLLKNCLMDEKIIGNMISVKKVDIWFLEPKSNVGNLYKKSLWVMKRQTLIIMIFNML